MIRILIDLNGGKIWEEGYVWEKDVLMKKLILLSFVCSQTILFGQTALTKVTFEDQESFLISSFPGNDNVSWTTATEHKYFNAGDYTSGTVSSCSYGYNDINAGQGATGDTLDINTEYYSLTNGTLIYNGTQVAGIPNNLPFKSLAQDNSGSVYVFGSYGGVDRYIWKITAGSVSAVYNFSLPAYGTALENYASVTYFEFSGNYYLMFIGDIQFGATTHSWAIVDVSNAGTISSVMFGNLSLNITNAKYINDGTDHLYFSIDNEIFEAISISSVLPNSIVYNIPSGQIINDFTITENGIVYVASTDGIYSSNVALNISELVRIGSTLYPNPNNGTFTISNINNADKVEILNELGQVVFESSANDQEINFNLEIPTGIYFVRVCSDEKVETIKFVKQ